MRRVAMENHGQHDMQNSATGFSVTSTYRRSFVRDLAKATTRMIGPAYHVTVPGFGPVVFETGMMTFENGTLVNSAGPQQVSGGDLGGVCPAFA